MVRPCRLITRQRSHIGFTEGLTFTESSKGVEKVRTQLAASWRGFVQMTMVRPCRLITRQRSHIGLTEGLTFN
jgi:hypothetical protein